MPEKPASADRDRLPARLRPFFWDYRLSELSWSRDRDLIASRILQAGDWPAITWLRRRLGDKNLRAWLISGGARALDRRRRNFWDLVLDVRTRPGSHAGSMSAPPEGDPAWERRTRNAAMKPSSSKRRPGDGPTRRTSPAAERSRAVRVSVELEMTPAERLTLALELSDLCEELAAAGRAALKEGA